jgi:hypothetical protein
MKYLVYNFKLKKFLDSWGFSETCSKRTDQKQAYFNYGNYVVGTCL